MESEMTALERLEWIARAQLQREIEDVRQRADLSYAGACKLVFKKYQKDS